MWNRDYFQWSTSNEHHLSTRGLVYASEFHVFLTGLNVFLVQKWILIKSSLCAFITSTFWFYLIQCYITINLQIIFFVSFIHVDMAAAVNLCFLVLYVCVYLWIVWTLNCSTVEEHLKWLCLFFILALRTMRLTVIVWVLVREHTELFYILKNRTVMCKVCFCLLFLFLRLESYRLGYQYSWIQVQAVLPSRFSKIWLFISSFELTERKQALICLHLKINLFYICVCVPEFVCPWKPEEYIGYHGAEVAYSYERPWMYWEVNLGFLQEWQVHLTNEPSLQLHLYLFETFLSFN